MEMKNFEFAANDFSFATSNCDEMRSFCEVIDKNTTCEMVNLHGSSIWNLLGKSKKLQKFGEMEYLDFFVVDPSMQTCVKTNDQGQHYISFGLDPNRRLSREFFDHAKAGYIANEIENDTLAMFLTEYGKDGMVDRYLVETPASVYSNIAFVPGCTDRFSVEKAMYFAKRLDDEANVSDDYDAKRFIVTRNASGVVDDPSFQKYTFGKIVNVMKNPFNRIGYLEVFDAAVSAGLEPVYLTATFDSMTLVCKSRFEHEDLRYTPVTVFSINDSARKKSSVFRGYALEDSLETFFTAGEPVDIPTKSDDAERVSSAIDKVSANEADLKIFARAKKVKCDVSEKTLEKSLCSLSKTYVLPENEKGAFNISGSMEDFRESVLRYLSSYDRNKTIKKQMLENLLSL